MKEYLFKMRAELGAYVYNWCPFSITMATELWTPSPSKHMGFSLSEKEKRVHFHQPFHLPLLWIWGEAGSKHRADGMFY